MFYFQTNELKFTAEFLGRVRLVGSVASLVGVGCYNFGLKVCTADVGYCVSHTVLDMITMLAHLICTAACFFCASAASLSAVQ